MSRASHDDSNDALNLLPEWREPVSLTRFFRAGAGSVAVHLLAVAIVLSLPAVDSRIVAPLIAPDLRSAIPLVPPTITAPPKQKLTQKDPNHGKPANEVNATSALQRAEPKARPFHPPAPSGPGTLPPAQIAEPPQIQAAVNAPPDAGIPPSAPKPVEKSRVALESLPPAVVNTPPPEHPIIQAPTKSVEELAREAAQSAARAPSPSTLSKGGVDSAAANPPELLSDPLGVDFKPYFLSLEATVRRHWLAVVPRSGQSSPGGDVVVEFSIDRKGSVSHIVIVTHSGRPAWDQLAIDGISQSLPFPPLPADYKANEIRVKVTFAQKTLSQ